MTAYYKNDVIKIAQYMFRLTGVPPEQAVKLIEVDETQLISEIKESVQREYKLNPIIAIQFIARGKILPDQLRLDGAGIRSQDVITVMATQAGGDGFKEITIITRKGEDNFKTKVKKLIYDDYPLESVDSTAVSKIGYNAENKTLQIIFPKGNEGEYHDVPFKIFEQFYYAESKGAFVHQILKNKYKYTKKE